MSLESFIAGRYLRARRREAFISVNTVISTGGVAIGVMALVVVIAVMTGADRQMRKNILGISAHVNVSRYGGAFGDWRQIMADVKKVPGVTAAAPSVLTQVLIKGPQESAGVMLIGIDPAASRKVTDLAPHIKRGSLSGLLPKKEGDEGRPGIILGRDLSLQIGAIVGDLVTVVAPATTLSPIGAMPTVRRYTVAGILESGWFQYDSTFAWVNITEAQGLLRLGDKVTTVEAAVRDPYRAREMARKIEEALPGFPFHADDWMSQYGPLWQALALEKLAMFVILMFIVLVAAFNIAGTLIMMVMEKRKDIAILKAMGATGRTVLKIFVINGMTIGLVGTALGVSLGSIICAIQDRYKLVSLDETVYPFGALPVALQFWDVTAIAAAALFIVFLATLYPAWQAARLDPVETIRYG